MRNEDMSGEEKDSMYYERINMKQRELREITNSFRGGTVMFPTFYIPLNPKMLRRNRE